MQEAAKPTKKLMSVDAHELALCILCALENVQPPPNLTAREALDQLSPAVQEEFLRAARAAFEHFMRCMQSGDLKIQEITNLQRGNA